MFSRYVLTSAAVLLVVALFSTPAQSAAIDQSPTVIVERSAVDSYLAAVGKELWKNATEKCLDKLVHDCHKYWSNGVKLVHCVRDFGTLPENWGCLVE